jgi:type IV secretory pathway component VirB8
MLFSPKLRAFLFKVLTKPEYSMQPDEEKPAGADTLSESDESFLSENEIKAIRLHNSSRSRRWWWWIIFAAVHLVVLAVYVGTVMELRDEIKKLRKHGPQMVLCRLSTKTFWCDYRHKSNHWTF